MAALSEAGDPVATEAEEVFRKEKMAEGSRLLNCPYKSSSGLSSLR